MNPDPYAAEISQVKEVAGRFSKNVNLSRTSPISLRIPEEEISIDNVTGKSDKYREGLH